MKISFAPYIHNICLPLIISSSKPNLCFLIDTGSTLDIIFSYVYEELLHVFSKIPMKSSMIMGIDGDRKITSQIEANLMFEDKRVSELFSVLDANKAIMQIEKESGIQIHGILGIPFLTQNKWILDFSDLTLQC